MFEILNLTIPQINLLVPHLGKHVHLKVFQSYPQEQVDEPSIEAWQAAGLLPPLKEVRA